MKSDFFSSFLLVLSFDLLKPRGKVLQLPSRLRNNHTLESEMLEQKTKLWFVKHQLEVSLRVDGQHDVSFFFLAHDLHYLSSNITLDDFPISLFHIKVAETTIILLDPG